MQTQALWKDGLEDVIAARSAICQVDGAEGRLYYRGYEIGELAAGASFEDVTYLLWFGELPEPAEAAAFRGALAAARDLPEPVLALLRGLPRDCHPSTPSARRCRWPPPSIRTRAPGTRPPMCARRSGW